MDIATRSNFIVFKTANSIPRTLTTISKSYREMVSKLFDPSASHCFEYNSINNNTRLILEVQGSEIIAKFCCNTNLRWDIMHAYNLMLINRLEVVMDTGYYVRADDTDRHMLHCLYRQINSAFMPESSLGKMLTKGFEQWHRIHVVICMSARRKGTRFATLKSHNCLQMVIGFCCKDTSPVCGIYQAACAKLELLCLERVHLKDRSIDKISKPRREIPRIQLATKTVRRNGIARVVDDPLLVGEGGGGGPVDDDDVIVIDD